MPSLDWIGKASVLNHHNEIPYRLVECNEVIGDLNAGNLIVKGDNLHALKALLPYYKGKVKMIYIDPPYNTGNSSWVYNDAMNAPEMKTWLDKTVDANDLSRSDKWLCMMYPRLKLLKEFLKEDGMIFISIDDAEVTNLRMICNEVFGKENFISSFIWKSRQNKDNRNITGVSIDHEYIVSYSKSNGHRVIIGDERKIDQYKNPDDDSRGLWTSANMVGLLPEDQRPNCHYNLINPMTSIDYGKPKMGWRYDKKTMQRLIDECRIIWPENPEGRPRRKVFLNELNETKPAFSSIIEESIYTRDGTQENENIFGIKSFDFPKPSTLIKTFIAQGTSEDDIIMDSFAGSGTTAHAVLAQNAMDGGNRKFILVEMEEYAKTITTERVRRVIEGYDFTGKEKTTLLEKKLTTAQILSADKMTGIAEEAQSVIDANSEEYDKINKEFKDNTLKIIGLNNISERKEGLGGGFRYCELGDGIIDENGGLNADVSAEALAKHLFFSEFGVPLETPLALPYIGSFRDVGLYLFFDKFERKRYATVTNDTHTSHIVYGISCTIDTMKLKDTGVIFRQLPFEIKER